MQDAADATQPKLIFCVRHAQSEQNVATAQLNSGNIGALGSLIRLGFDAPLSDAGERQLAEASSTLSGFAAQHGAALVAHSPYARAAATAKALFACSGVPFQVIPELRERTPVSYIHLTLPTKRIV